MDKYFIMLNFQKGGGITPMVDESENVLIFDSYDEAFETARDNSMGKAFGYNIYMVDDGI